MRKGLRAYLAWGFLIGYSIVIFVVSRPNPLEYSDARNYVGLARGLINNNEYKESWPPGKEFRAWRPPLYPLTIAFILRISGDNISWIIHFQILLVIASVFLLFKIARDTYASNTAAFIAGIMLCSYWPLIRFAYHAMSEILFVFTFLCALAAWIHFLKSQNAWYALIAGVLLGLNILTRTVSLPILAFYAIISSIIHMGTWIVHSKNAPATAIKRSLVCHGVFLAAAAFVVSISIIRNYCVLGHPVMVNSANAMNFYFGTLRDYDWNTVHTTVIYPLRESHGEVGSMQRLMKLAIENIKREPASYILLKFKTYLWYLLPNSFPGMRFAFLFIVLLSCVSAVDTFFRRNINGMLIIFLYASMIAAASMAFYSPRFGLVAYPLGFLSAAHGMILMLSYIRSRIDKWKKANIHPA